MSEKNLVIVSIICIIIGIGIVLASSIDISQTIKINEPLNISIHFCPKDNCKSYLINIINSSNNIKCAFYDLDIIELMNLLQQKQALVITDIENKVPNTITNEGNQLMHNKFCILDNNIIITGSMNPTKSCTGLNNNNFIIINSKELAKNYEEEFKELQNGIFGKGEKTKYTKFQFLNTSIENYFCPEDKCSEKVIKYLESAKTSIYFMTFSFTHYQIANTLIKKHNQGVEVKGIIERTQQVQGNQFDKLKSNNISVIYDNNPYKMHHKVFIIDNQTVILGSFNPTGAADTKNDENILIIQNEEVAKKFLQEFNSLF